MSNSTDTFGGMIMESFSNPFEKLLQQSNVKEFGFRTAKVLIARLGPADPGKENIELYCGLFDEALKLSVNTSKLELWSNPISINNLQTFEEKNTFFNMVESTKITVPWLTAQEALKTGYEITRESWQGRSIFMTIYNNIVDENQKYLDLKIYYQDKKEFSTGWAPSTEDKEANDWIIKKKS